MNNGTIMTVAFVLNIIFMVFVFMISPWFLLPQFLCLGIQAGILVGER
jgi:hypothetical protein